MLSTIVIYRRQKADLYFITSIILGIGRILLLASKWDMRSILFGESLGGLSFGLFFALSSEYKMQALPKLLLLSTIVSFLCMALFASIYHGENDFNLSIEDILLALVHGLILDSLGHLFWTRVQSMSASRNEDLGAIVSLVYYLPIISLILILGILRERHIFHWYFAGSLVLITVSALLPFYLRKIRTKKEYQ